VEPKSLKGENLLGSSVRNQEAFNKRPLLKLFGRMIIFKEKIYPLQIIEGLLNYVQIGGENRLGQTLENAYR
jgi:hypothetical protein